MMEVHVEPPETELKTELKTGGLGPTINQPDLLFAWLSPIEKKVAPNETSNIPHSPFLRAKSALRRTFRGSVAGAVPSGLRTTSHKQRGACHPTRHALNRTLPL